MSANSLKIRGEKSSNASSANDLFLFRSHARKLKDRENQFLQVLPKVPG